MIQVQTRLKVADNTGAKTIQCIRIMGRSRTNTAEVGDVIIAAVVGRPNARRGRHRPAVIIPDGQEYDVPTAATSASTRTRAVFVDDQGNHMAPGLGT